MNSKKKKEGQSAKIDPSKNAEARYIDRHDIKEIKTLKLKIKSLLKEWEKQCQCKSCQDFRDHTLRMIKYNRVDCLKLIVHHLESSSKKHYE